MGNKITIRTAFENSSTHPDEQNPLPALRLAIDEGRDAIESWRRRKALSDSGMAQILGCSQRGYEMHREWFLEPSLFEPSPLTGEHFLNFARHIRVHPYDLASYSAAHEKSYLPAQYEALQTLFFDTKTHSADRQKAGLGLMLESRRYDDFSRRDPENARRFGEILAYSERWNSPNAGKRVMREVETIADEDLRTVLLRSFSTEKSARPPFQPHNHMDDYHAVKRLKMEDRLNGNDILQQQDMALARKVRNAAIWLYGERKADDVLSDLSNAVDGLPERKCHDVLLKLKENLKGRNLLNNEFADKAIDSLCDDVLTLAKRREETRISTALLRADFRNMEEFDAWFIEARQPQFSYLHNLYCNKARSEHVSDREHEQLREFKNYIIT